MKRLFGLAAMIVLGALVAPGVGAEDKKKEDKKVPSIVEIMTAAHKGANSQLSKAKAALKDKDFEDLSAAAAKLVQLGTDLGKNKPPAGDAKNWKKLTSTYVKSATTLKKAADDKKAKSAAGAIGQISALCAKCHKAHKKAQE